MLDRIRVLFGKRDKQKSPQENFWTMSVSWVSSEIANARDAGKITQAQLEEILDNTRKQYLDSLALAMMPTDAFGRLMGMWAEGQIRKYSEANNA